MSSIVATYQLVISLIYRLYQTVGLITMILGTIGNLCNCFVFLCIPALKKHPNASFIIASAIGSLFYINVGLYPAVASVFTGTNPMTRSLFLCKTNYWITYSSGCFSFMCNCFAALGQYLITLPRARWHRLITRVRALIMILLTAFFWLSLFFPLVVSFTLGTTSNTCSASPLITNYGSCCQIIGYYLLPMILIVICFCLTRANLTRIRRRFRTLDAAVTRMMLIQMSILLINGIPSASFLIYLLATIYVPKTQLQSIYEILITYIVILAAFVTNGSSFWIYITASTAFRKNIKEYFSKYKIFRRRSTRISIEPITVNRTIP